MNILGIFVDPFFCACIKFNNQFHKNEKNPIFAISKWDFFLVAAVITTLNRF